MKSDIRLLPVLFGGTGFESASQDMPTSLPERFEIGTMNISAIAGLNAALKWVHEQGVSKLYQEESAKRKRLLELFTRYDFIQTVGNIEDRQYVGIVSCVIDGISSDIAGQLFSERNISVRTGLHCAPLAHRFLGTYPAGTIRFSVNSLTSDDDFDALYAAIADIGNNL